MPRELQPMFICVFTIICGIFHQPIFKRRFNCHSLFANDFNITSQGRVALDSLHSGAIYLLILRSSRAYRVEVMLFAASTLSRYHLNERRINALSAMPAANRYG
ncbi:hypothetical protein [Shewanella algidipiscicola]|uniref:hypothetical protein n=1 Tax=Shewanella algidipiscicola TaxID=614070 RepID=UPI000D78C58F|nr:hypothetical protein [Shewanella algidipiscicola]